MHYSKVWKTTRDNHMQILFESGAQIYYLPTFKSDLGDVSHVAPFLFSKHKIEASQVIMHIFQQYKADISLLTGKQMTGSGCQLDK